MKEFTPVPFLSMNGVPFAEVSPTKLTIFFGVEHEDADCFNVDEATRLRDWLNLVLPDETMLCASCHGKGCAACAGSGTTDDGRAEHDR